ncbi:hypothetical protein ASG07_06540 [Sphingomonas sp. Leaf343]|nr:hypothetical protein ASG07_06540 [Sphingomonas sp. Leaf343]
MWFRTLAVVLILWGAMGVLAWVQQMRLGAEAMGPATAYDRALYASLPGWYDWVYLIAVGTGLVGAAMLLLGSALARPVFAVSLVGVVVMFGWMFLATDIVVVKGVPLAMGFPIVIVAIAVLQLWLAGMAARRGWIG